MSRQAVAGAMKLKKKLALEVFISDVVIFDVMGSYSYHLPIWPFLPLWMGAIVEIEIGARVLSWLSKRVHLPALKFGSSPPGK